MKLSPKTNGVVLYRGPSMLDGAPIVVIATGLAASSTNVKTGALIQTWIIREDVSPVDAIHSGADASICGGCPHRGTLVQDLESGVSRNVGRSCYVQVFQAPRNVFESYHRGLYPEVTPSQAAKLLRGRRVRLGAYGDPAAVPLQLWEVILQHVEAKTGYSHQWRVIDPAFARFVMASCDTAADYEAAKAMGYRTFRVRLANEPLAPREIACPASAEMGNKTNCAACVACGGTTAKARVDIAIIAHGSAAVTNAYKRLRAA